MDDVGSAILAALRRNAPGAVGLVDFHPLHLSDFLAALPGQRKDLDDPVVGWSQLSRSQENAGQFLVTQYPIAAFNAPIRANAFRGGEVDDPLTHAPLEEGFQRLE